MKENFVTIRHPELGVESRVLKESVPVWVENGWELVDLGGDETPGVFQLEMEEEAEDGEDQGEGSH